MFWFVFTYGMLKLPSCVLTTLLAPGGQECHRGPRASRNVQNEERRREWGSWESRDTSQGGAASVRESLGNVGVEKAQTCFAPLTCFELTFLPGLNLLTEMKKGFCFIAACCNSPSWRFCPCVCSQPFKLTKTNMWGWV